MMVKSAIRGVALWGLTLLSSHTCLHLPDQRLWNPRGNFITADLWRHVEDSRASSGTDGLFISFASHSEESESSGWRKRPDSDDRDRTTNEVICASLVKKFNLPNIRATQHQPTALCDDHAKLIARGGTRAATEHAQLEIGGVASTVCASDQIPSNPDISGVATSHFAWFGELICYVGKTRLGIGVRISIYIQVTIVSIYGILYTLLHDGELSFETERYNAVLAGITTMLVSGFALLISAIIQARAKSLEVYHALIVLNLCWIISLTASSFMLAASTMVPNAFLFEEHKRTLSTLVKSATSVAAPGLHRGRRGIHLGTLSPDISVSVDRLLYVAVAHMCCTCAIGLWVFRTLRTFDRATPACTLITNQSFLGWSVPISWAGVKMFWLTMYSIGVAPVINMLCHWAVILLVFAVLIISLRIVEHLWFLPLRLLRCLGYLRDDSNLFRTFMNSRVAYIICRAWPLNWDTATMFSISSFILNLLIIASTELTITDNVVAPGESSWTFGQTLAIILTVPGLWTVWSEARSTYKRYQERKDEHFLVMNALRGPPLAATIPLPVQHNPPNYRRRSF